MSESDEQRAARIAREEATYNDVFNPKESVAYFLRRARHHNIAVDPKTIEELKKKMQQL